MRVGLHGLARSGAWRLAVAKGWNGTARHASRDHGCRDDTKGYRSHLSLPESAPHAQSPVRSACLVGERIPSRGRSGTTVGVTRDCAFRQPDGSEGRYPDLARPDKGCSSDCEPCACPAGRAGTGDRRLGLERYPGQGIGSGVAVKCCGVGSSRNTSPVVKRGDDPIEAGACSRARGRLARSRQSWWRGAAD